VPSLPAGAEDFFDTYIRCEKTFFAVVDGLWRNKTSHKFSSELGDTGMGKTSFLLNYYARHWGRRKRARFNIVLIPLGGVASDQKIAEVTNKPDTVLFLDAFDEDTRAIRDHTQIFRQILESSSRFKHVLITCRTQFFSKEDEIPREAPGIIRVGPIGPGDERTYSINKLYLSPFSDEQINRYIRRRFPVRQIAKRKRAFELIKNIEDLPARPMLLAQIQLIVSLREECKYTFQVYEQMIHSWLNREKGIADPVALREFCEYLAVDIYANRSKRGARRFLPKICPNPHRKAGIPVPRIEHIRGRSLLNRDAQGH
jgi:hypothetical protein